MKVLILAGSLFAMWLVATYVIPVSFWDAATHQYDDGDTGDLKGIFILVVGVVMAAFLMDWLYGRGPRPPGNDSGME